MEPNALRCGLALSDGAGVADVPQFRAGRPAQACGRRVDINEWYEPAVASFVVLAGSGVANAPRYGFLR